MPAGVGERVSGPASVLPCGFREAVHTLAAFGEAKAPRTVHPRGPSPHALTPSFPRWLRSGAFVHNTGRVCGEGGEGTFGLGLFNVFQEM